MFKPPSSWSTDKHIIVYVHKRSGIYPEIGGNTLFGPDRLDFALVPPTVNSGQQVKPIICRKVVYK